MATAERDEIRWKSLKRKLRLIVHLCSSLVSHSLLVRVICCIMGLIALLLLPVLAKNTYISENALLPGLQTQCSLLEMYMKFVRDILDMSITEEGRKMLWHIINERRWTLSWYPFITWFFCSRATNEAAHSLAATALS